MVLPVAFCFYLFKAMRIRDFKVCCVYFVSYTAAKPIIMFCWRIDSIIGKSQKNKIAPWNHACESVTLLLCR